jgi:hypothetical protein
MEAAPNDEDEAFDSEYEDDEDDDDDEWSSLHRAPSFPFLVSWCQRGRRISKCVHFIIFIWTWLVKPLIKYVLVVWTCILKHLWCACRNLIILLWLVWTLSHLCCELYCDVLIILYIFVICDPVICSYYLYSFITDLLSQCSHMCRHPTKFCRNIWIISHVHILVWCFSCHLLCTHLGGANHILLQNLKFYLLLKILIGCHQSPKMGRLKVHLGPSVGFGWVMTSN